MRPVPDHGAMSHVLLTQNGSWTMPVNTRHVFPFVCEKDEGINHFRVVLFNRCMNNYIRIIPLIIICAYRMGKA